MRNLKTLYLVTIGALLMLSSCSSIIKSQINKDAENVPTDFGKSKTTILVIEKGNDYNKKVDDVFKKNYTGNYIFVKSEELDTKYNDMGSYRYVLADNVGVLRTRVITSTIDPNVGVVSKTSEVRYAASRSFQILDRKTDKIHDTRISSGTSWQTILKTYLQKLDTERKKNGGN